MSCNSCAACSATADCARCPLTRARLCSFSHWANVLPVWPTYTPCVLEDGGSQSLDTNLSGYLDFDSHYPLAHKVAVARTLLTRADWICASVPDMDVEKRRITGALSSNGYPTALVKKTWHPTLHSTPPLELDTPKVVGVIPYVKHLSESIRRILSPLKIRTCFRPHRTLTQHWSI